MNANPNSNQSVHFGNNSNRGNIQSSLYEKIHYESKIRMSKNTDNFKNSYDSILKELNEDNPNMEKISKLIQDFEINGEQESAQKFQTAYSTCLASCYLKKKIQNHTNQNQTHLNNQVNHNTINLNLTYQNSQNSSEQNKNKVNDKTSKKNTISEYSKKFLESFNRIKKMDY